MARVIEFRYFCDNYQIAKHPPRTVEGDTVMVWSPKREHVVELDICDGCLGLLTLPQLNELADALGRETDDPDTDPLLVCRYGCQSGKPFKDRGGLARHMTRKHPEDVGA